MAANFFFFYVTVKPMFTKTNLKIVNLKFHFKILPYGETVWVIIGLGNGLLSDGTWALAEPMLTPKSKFLRGS